MSSIVSKRQESLGFVYKYLMMRKSFLIFILLIIFISPVSAQTMENFYQFYETN